MFALFAVRLREASPLLTLSTRQSHARRLHCQREIRPQLESNRAARRIQTQWRRYDAMIEFELRLIDQEAALVIQKHWRGSRQRRAYVRKVNSLILLQACVRGRLTRKQHIECREAATSIQRIWRGFWAQLQLQLDLMEVITIQSAVRRRLAVLERERRRHAILVLQRNCRCRLAIRAATAMRIERNERNRCLVAAVVCQVSGCLHFELIKLISCTPNGNCVQSFVRRFQAVQTFRHVLRDNNASTVIQAHWKGAKARKIYRVMKKSAILIQVNYRGYNDRKTIRIYTESAVRLQKIWRGCLARIQFVVDVHDIVLVQAVIRQWITNRLIASREAAAILIESKWRAHLACTLYHQKRGLCIAMQAAYRGLLVRRELGFLGACSSVIQARWRCYWARLQYRLDLVEIIIVQSVSRRRAAIIESQKRKAAVSAVQCFARMWCAVQLTKRLRLESIEHNQRQVASVCLQVRRDN